MNAQQRITLVAVLVEMFGGDEGWATNTADLGRMPDPRIVFARLADAQKAWVRERLGFEPDAPPRPEPGTKATEFAQSYKDAVARSAANLAKP